MQNVLIVAPDGRSSALRNVIIGLERGGHTVVSASLDSEERGSVQSLCEAFDGRPPDLLIADLSETVDVLPLRHAARLLRLLWGEDSPMPPRLALVQPCLLNTPGWEAHADDFALPPYSDAEILGRIRLLLFRKRHVQSSDTLKVDSITLDLASGRVFDGDGRDGGLTPREFDLLRFLAVHRGKFFGRDRLLDMVWGVDFDGGERTVDIHIRRLRAKLPETVGNRIETRRGVGYGLVA